MIDEVVDRALLPAPRGPISESVTDYLAGDIDRLPVAALRAVTDMAGIFDDPDLQLGLYCCYELSYRAFGGQADAFEWDPQVLALRAQLESRFVDALRCVVPPSAPAPGSAPQLIRDLVDGFEGPSLSRFLLEDGDIGQFREFAIHRSIYQLKEADPHTWAIPRFAGVSRSAMIEIQMDEYGRGEPGQAHAELFARTMVSLGLDPTYDAHLDAVPAVTLATTNLISLFGLHRRFLPALLGHLAVFEMTSVVPMGRYAATCDRLGLPAGARRFYDVHVTADAVHGPLAADHLVGDFVAAHPGSLPMVLWGAQALMVVERHFAEHLLGSWAAQRSSLVRSAPARPRWERSAA